MRIGALEVGEPLEDLETMTVGVFMHGINKSAVLDPGAMVCVMHPTTYNQIPLGQRPKLQPLTRPLQGVSGHLQPEVGWQVAVHLLVIGGIGNKSLIFMPGNLTAFLYSSPPPPLKMC